MARDLRLRLKEGELRKLYSEEGRSLGDIGRLYGVSRMAVWKYCKAAGLARRTRSSARLEAQKRGKVPQKHYDINDRFFSRWSAEMAYVLGLIATDGCISRHGVISLCINDKGLLEKVKMAMEAEHEVRYYGHQAGLYSIHFARERLISDLAGLGIMPNKSLDIKFPDVPDEYMTDFIRGVFDGDGSVYHDPRSTNCPLRTKFCSASKAFISTLETKLCGLGLPKRRIHEEQKKNSILYTIRYGHKDSIKLFDILYGGPPNSIYLDRKYNVFQPYIPQ